MFANPIHKMSNKQKVVISATATAVVGTVLTVKYRSAIAAATAHGADEAVNNWLREMSDNNLSLLVLPMELATKMFDQANQIALTN